MNQQLIQILLGIHQASLETQNILCGAVNEGELYRCDGVICANCCFSKSGYPHGVHYLKPFITFSLWESL